MAKKLGVLSVDLTARTVEFAQALGRAEKRTRRFRRNVARDLQRVGRNFAVLGTSAATGLALLTRSSLKSIDSLAKTADKLGTTTEGLAGLRFAAEQTGVKVTTLDMAIQRMTRRMAEAAKGTGEAKAAIAELGLDAVALSAAGPEEAMRAIADALQNVENKSDRLRLAFKLFDSEGVAVVNTLAQGREGLDAFQQEAESLGLAINRIDAKQIEMANDAMNRGSKVAVGLGNAIAVAVSPVIQEMANRFVEAARSSDGFKSEVNAGMEVAARAVQFVADMVLGIRTAFDAVRIAMLAFKREMLQLMANTKREIADIKTLFIRGISRGRGRAAPADTEALDASIANIDAEILALENSLGERIARRLEQTDPILKRFKEITVAAEKAAAASVEAGPTAVTGTPVSVIDPAAERERDKLKSLAESIRRSIETPMERAIRKIQEARQLLSGNPPLLDQATFEKYKQTLIDGVLEPLDGVSDKAKRMQERLKSISEQAARNMQDAFADFLFDPFENGLKGMLKSFIDTMRRMLANQMAERVFSFLGQPSGGGGFVGT